MVKAPSPETSTPEVLTDPEAREAALTGPPTRRAAKPAELGLSAVLPGAGHLIRGEVVAGMSLLFVWGVMLSVLFFSWGRIAEVFTARRMPIDGLVAVVTIGVVMLLVWGWGLYDLKKRAGRPRRIHGESQWSMAFRHFRKNRIALMGLIFMLALYVITLLTPLIAPFDPAEQGDIVATRYLAPSFENLMGTDRFGRDIFSRVLYGSRISLTIGFLAVSIGVAVGVLLGAVAGYFGRRVDAVIMRFTDMMLSIPRLVLLLVTIALFEPSLTLIIIVLGLTGWMGIARIVRGEVLSLREREFVQAARALGMGPTRIISRHIIPNTLAPIIVYATLGIGTTILVEAALSFLGLGVQPPTASWGNMIADGRDSLITAWWIATFPGLAIVFTVTAFNLLGDGLRDALDPRLRT